MSLGEIQSLLVLFEFQVVENREQRSCCLLKKPNFTLRDTRPHSFSGVWKEFMALCPCVRQRLPAPIELLAPTEFSLSKELGARLGWETLPLTQTSYCWLAVLRFHLGQNMQAAVLPLCSTTNMGKKKQSKVLPIAARSLIYRAWSRGTKNWIRSWLQAQILCLCVCFWKLLEGILFFKTTFFCGSAVYFITSFLFRIWKQHTAVILIYSSA